MSMEKRFLEAHGIKVNETESEKISALAKPNRIEEVVGTVLWKDDKDGNGIIKDTQGNEYYFDKSATPIFPSLKRKARVTFIPARLKPDNILVAREVSIVGEGLDEAKYNVTLKNGVVMSVMASSPKEAIEKANSGKGKQVGSYTSKQKADKAELDEAAGYVHRNINYSLENLGGRYWALVIVNKENKEKFERHPLDSKMLGAVLDSVGAVDFDNWEGAKVSLGKLQFRQLGIVSAPETKKDADVTESSEKYKQVAKKYNASTDADSDGTMSFSIETGKDKEKAKKFAKELLSTGELDGVRISWNGFDYDVIAKLKK